MPSDTPERRPRRRALIPVLAAAALAVSAAPALAHGSGGASAGDDTSAASAPATSKVKVKTLKHGSRGRPVRKLQRALRLHADGVYGKRTVRAVKRFQRRKALKADGVAGLSTQRALGLVSAPKQTADAPSGDTAGVLEQIAECESGGDPTSISKSGRYRGKYQFSRATWRSAGGSGDPADAPEAEQDQRAAVLYEREGTKPWPVCGK